MADTNKSPTAGILEQSLLEMRWRCLSLAADLDRAERGGVSIMSDARLQKLRRSLAILLDGKPGRAERVQMVFSDMTPLE